MIKNVRLLNEADVQDEIAAPFLAALGYQRGTENDILRQLTVGYAKNFLGRKKSSDTPLVGRPDYVLSVVGAARWVLEIKASDVEIGIDEIDQTLSYLRHPEIGATYGAILNGKNFVLYHFSQSSKDEPRIAVPVTTPDDLAKKLINVLSPFAIRRDCSPPKVDLNLPLARGLRSSAEIIGGELTYENFSWEASLTLPQLERAKLDEVCRRLSTTTTYITAGTVWRDNDSRVRAKLAWAAPHLQIMQFAQDKNLFEAEYVALSSQVSDDVAQPTVFDVVGNIKIEKGETLFDLVRWKPDKAGVSGEMEYRGQVTGYICENIFSGTFQTEYEMFSPVMPSLKFYMYGQGSFNVRLSLI